MFLSQWGPCHFGREGKALALWQTGSGILQCCSVQLMHCGRCQLSLFFFSHSAAEVLPTSPKQRKEGESEESMKEDYEEWKRKILENALKSKQADASETSSNWSSLTVFFVYLFDCVHIWLWQVWKDLSFTLPPCGSIWTLWIDNVNFS